MATLNETLKRATELRATCLSAFMTPSLRQKDTDILADLVCQDPFGSDGLGDNGDTTLQMPANDHLKTEFRVMALSEPQHDPA